MRAIGILVVHHRVRSPLRIGLIEVDLLTWYVPHGVPVQQRFPVTEQGQVARGGSALRLGKGHCFEDAEVPSGDQLSAQQEDPVEHGNPGGLKDTFCNSANSGGTPTTDEVAYATYLLTGTQLMPYSRTVVPRYTLNDAA